MNEEFKQNIIDRYNEWNDLNSKEFAKKEKQLNSLVSAFIKKFSIENIKVLKKDDYIEGKGSHDTFCYWVENKLNAVGNMHGSTAQKFGLFFSQEYNQYRTSPRYSKNSDEALAEIKIEIVKLIESISSNNLKILDSVNLTTMFKLKIAYLYNHDKLLPIYSEDHINKLIILLGYHFDKKATISEKEELLFRYYKSLNLDNCSPLKFMYFIYDYSFGVGYELKNVELKKLLTNSRRKITIEVVNELEDNFKEKDYSGRKSIYHENQESIIRKDYSGKMGEELAFNYFEKNKKSLKIKEIKYYCMHDREEANDLAGCDIEYITYDGVHHYVEVKSSSGKRHNRDIFYMSDIEYRKMKDNVETYYVLYFDDVYNTSIAKQIPASKIIGIGHPVKYAFDIKEI